MMMDFLIYYTLGVVTGGFAIALFKALRKVSADACSPKNKQDDSLRRRDGV